MITILNITSIIVSWMMDVLSPNFLPILIRKSHSDCAQHLVAQCIQALELHTTLAGSQNLSWVNMQTQMETQNIPAAIGDLMNLYESQESQTKNVDFENSNVNHTHVRVFHPRFSEWHSRDFRVPRDSNRSTRSLRQTFAPGLRVDSPD